jgi:glycerophosphoryl diester phosphodiesterase
MTGAHTASGRSSSGNGDPMTQQRIHAAVFRTRTLALAIGSALAVAACGGSDDPAPLATLDGAAPLVVAHRGASGYLPEETIEAYQRAIDLGADVIEPDVVSTSDGVLIARHDPQLSITTDIAAHPEFANRKKTRSLDGDTPTSDWWASDFTLAEIKTLRAIQPASERAQQFNGLYQVATLQQVFDLAKAQSIAKGRTIAVYPETKNPTFHRDLGVPLEDKLIAVITAFGWNAKTAPVFVQSFEPSSLKEMRAKGLAVRMVQLVDGDDYDYRNGAVSNPDGSPFSRPYDWTKIGKLAKFPSLLTPAGLADVKTYADGIGPWKPYLVPLKGRFDAGGNMIDVNGDGRIDPRDATTATPTTLVRDAHAAGLFVHEYTFRNEARRLASDYAGDPKAEYLQHFRLGVDGVFSDFTDTAVAARAAYLLETGR